MKRFASFVFRYLFEEAHWKIGIAQATPADFVASPKAVNFTWIPFKDSSADPAFARIGNEPALLYERIGSDRQGRLAFTKLDTVDGSYNALLEDAIHTSYPFVFDYEGEQYVIPERSHAGRIDLYKLTGGRLDFVKTLVENFAGLDATVVQHDGLWWMFATDAQHLRHAALCVFYADTPLGPWTAHPGNPVKIDISSSRPAGRPFLHNGKLHRPGQDCAGRYGRAITINEVETLDKERFAERVTTTIEAHDIAGLSRHVGVHTLAHTDGWIAIDAYSLRLSFRKPFELLRERLRGHA